VYNKKKFPGLVYRVKAPKAAFLIFTSGKIVCTGSKNIEDVRTVITTLAKKLKSIGFEKVDLEPEIHVQNIVAFADLGRDPQIGCSFWNSLAESDLLDMLLRGTS